MRMANDAHTDDFDGVPAPGGEGARDDGRTVPAPPLDEDYAVECVLKESPVELTQLVRLRSMRSSGPEGEPCSDGAPIHGDEPLGGKRPAGGSPVRARTPRQHPSRRQLFVRKLIRTGSGLGTVYRDVYAAQRSGLNFPHLPRVISCDERGAWLVVVMSYAQGVTLRELADQTPAKQRTALARTVFPELCAAASELHEGLSCPVIHRDLTPSNVIVDPGDLRMLTLIDLGIARTFKSESATDTGHFGTKPYAPPEQYGFGQTDVRTDVFALGLTLFYCLTGRDPTQADREASFRAPGVPEGLAALIARASAFDPAERFASARELSAAFGKALTGGASATSSRDKDKMPPPPSGAERPISSASRVLGIAWNVIVLMAFVMFTAANVTALYDRIIGGKLEAMYVAIALAFQVALLVVGFLLADRRDLRRRIPALRNSTAGRELAVGALALVLDVAALLVAYLVLLLVGLA